MYQHLLVVILSLALPFFLYFGRQLDDNRLTSWNWAFGAGVKPSFLVALIAAHFLAWLCSRVSFYEKAKAPFLFVVSFVMSACFWSEPEVIVDAARYFSQAKHLELYGAGFFAKEWGRSIFAWTDLPLVPFLYGLVFKFLGEHRLLIQILNSILFSSTVVLTFQLGKVLWDEEVGLWAGFLLLGFPYLYTQVPLMLVDVPTMFFLLLAVVACVSALKKGGPNRIIAASFALFLVFYAKFSSWVLLTVMPVICGYYLLQQPKQTIRRGGALAMLSLIFIGVLFLLYKEIFLDQVAFLVEYQKPGLKRWSESYVSTFLFQMHPLITVAALFSFVAAVRKMDFRFIIISFLVLLFLFMGVKRIRYTLPLFPMLALMAAYGLEAAIQNKGLRKHLIFSIVGTSFVIAFLGFLPLLKSLGVQNLQQAGRYLNALSVEHMEVVSFAGENAAVSPDMAVPVLDIYTRKNLWYKKQPAGTEILEKAQNAPLRFTWEYPLPQYYSAPDKNQTADGLVVISDDPDRPLPESVENEIKQYPVRTKFHQSSNIFQHQTFVTVYHK